MACFYSIRGETGGNKALTEKKGLGDLGYL